MQYFQRLSDSALVLPILHVVARNAHWWGAKPNEDDEEIVLRAPRDHGDLLEAHDDELLKLLPGAKDMCFDLMRGVRGSRLGKVRLVKLVPGSRSVPDPEHADYVAYYTRYYVILQGLPGATVSCGDETVAMMTGETWWFIADALKGIANNSKDDWVCMQVDIRIDK